VGRERELLLRIAEKLGLRARAEPIEIAFEGQYLHLEIAREHEDLRRGLSGRRRLGPGRGLVLVLPPEPGPQGAISTRDMRFPIDVVFFDGRGVVIEVAAGLAPGLFPGHPVPPGATVALELVAGRAAQLGLAARARVPALAARLVRRR
jgi:uncharacterized membrane protein (UPF0127 family)